MATATETKKAAGKPLGKAGINEAAKSQELKDLGWRTEPLDSGLWAYEINGDRRIGPAASMAALHTMVTLASGKPAANGNGKGNGTAPAEAAEAATGKPVDQRLPSMEEPEIDELNRLADICLDLEDKKRLAKTESADADDLMRVKMREFGRKRYSRRGWSIVIEDTEKLVKKKDKNTPPKNPRKETKLV